MATKILDAKPSTGADDALAMAFQAHMAEYAQLQEGMRCTMDGARQVLINALLVSAAAVPVLTLLIQQQIYIVLLLVAFVFAGATWLFQWHLHSIFVAGAYLKQVLIPRATEVLQQSQPDLRLKLPVFEFEHIFALARAHTWKRLLIRGLASFQAFIALGILELPGVIALGVFWAIKGNVPWVWWETALFSCGAILMASALGFATISPYLAKQYFR